jgi:hypothetical protein
MDGYNAVLYANGANRRRPNGSISEIRLIGSRVRILRASFSRRSLFLKQFRDSVDSHRGDKGCNRNHNAGNAGNFERENKRVDKPFMSIIARFNHKAPCALKQGIADGILAEAAESDA